MPLAKRADAAQSLSPTVRILRESVCRQSVAETADRALRRSYESRQIQGVHGMGIA